MPNAKRVTPIASWSIVVTFALMGAALFATVWSTRSTVNEASGVVKTSERAAVAAKVRSDLRDLRGDVAQDDLEAIFSAHTSEGLRYLAMYDETQKTVIGAVGTPQNATDVIQIDLRAAGPRRNRVRDRNDQHRFVIEVDPEATRDLVQSSNRTLLVGGLAATALLGVAIVMIVREGRRRAEERAAEHARRLASLGEMSAVLAHEIKNPLASLKGNAQLLAQMLPEGDKPRKKADRVVEEAMRLEKLTSDLLMFVRTGSIRRVETSPASIVTDVIAQRPVVVENHAPATWPLDGERFREVVANLVDNALAAVGDAPSPAVAVRLDRVRDALVLEVGDRGPGVPEDQRDKIFEPFITTKTQGTGLGLALVRRIVELHGGTIAVLSNPGGGALFRVEIPRG